MTEQLIRAFAGGLDLRGDGDLLTVVGLVVPFGQEADITELRPSGVLRYREMFTAGAFQRAMRAPNRVSLLFEHAEGVAFDQRIGFGRSFRESSEGLIGEFRLDKSRADHARDVLTTSHRGLSIGFMPVWPRPNTEREGELVVRTSVALGHVACVAEPAYALAGVTAIRSGSDDEPTDADRQAEEQARQDAELMRWFGEHKEYSLPK